MQLELTHAGPPSTDGRFARRDRNRTAVLDAVVELFSEGVVDPSPETVATRAGISPRSVYRYFEDRDALLRAAIEHQVERVRGLYLIHRIGEGTRTERAVRFVEGRLRLYDGIAATARASRVRAASNPILREQVERTRVVLREQIERHFAPELRSMPPVRRKARVSAIDALFELESLEHYRLHRGFTVREARGLLLDALQALLGPDEPDR